MTDLDPELDLVLERQMAVQPQTLWRCWTEPDLLQQWFCPKPWQVTDAEIDARPGGKFNFIMRGPDGEVVPYRTCFLEVVPARRIVATDALSEGYRPNSSSFITTVLTFTPKDGGTFYRAAALHNNVEARKQHEDMGFHDGWGTTATQLEELAKSL